jgi:hypothetical protein
MNQAFSILSTKVDMTYTQVAFRNGRMNRSSTNQVGIPVTNNRLSLFENVPSLTEPRRKINDGRLHLLIDTALKLLDENLDDCQKS